MTDFLSYVFWPRPPKVPYENPKVMVLLGLCAALVVVSFLIRWWRGRVRNPITKKLMRSWPSAAFWFGIVGLILVVARTEDITFISMRFWWVVWVASAVLYVFLQVRMFRTKHYEKLPGVTIDDPREKYLPKRKK